MCFYTEYSFFPEISETSAEIATAPIRCDECARMIVIGQKYTHVYMQEYEDEARDFRNDDDDEISGPWEECDGPNAGETFDYDCCEDCSRLLQAIEAQEIVNGCKGEETRPGLGGLRESIGELDPCDRDAYYDRACTMFPDLDLTFLGKMLRRE